MKKSIFLTVIVVVLIVGCSKEPLSEMELLNTSLEYDLQRGGGFNNGTNSNQMIVRYDPVLTETDKQTMRDEYGVTSIKKCECADPTLELWIFDRLGGGNNPTGNTLEQKVLSAKEEDSLEGVNVNRIFQHDGTKLQSAFGSPDMTIALDKRVANNTNVTIAVLDTGVDYNYFGFESPFLYNSEESGRACSSNGYHDYIGWDFVNQDNDPFDDHGHGTVISDIIVKQLSQYNIDFQILPIKAFDANGNGTLFDILCGLKYATNNSDVDIVNMSFGWYNVNYELLELFIEEAESEAVLVSSAGNDTSNNDNYVHYPSSYPSENIISVAALSDSYTNIELAWFSNFGPSSVDIAAKGENLPFYTTPETPIFVSGTSYSNAFTSAFCALNYYPGMTPQQLKSATISNTVPNNNLNMVQYSSYINN